MIRQHTRGADKTFLFRGAATAGAECDLLPIATQDGDGSQLMLWASLAPAKAEQVKQKRIKTGALPFVTPTPDIFTPVVQSLPMKPCQEVASEDAAMQGDASPPAGASAVKDKLRPEAANSDAAAKRQKVKVREVPKGCVLLAAAKDGNCVYHIGDGLRWLKEQPKAFHHLDLRARVAEHLARHKEDYEPAWPSDGRPGPDGTALPDWGAFVAQVALPSKYSGEAELKALCRLFSIRVIVIPADPLWKVCSYGKAKYKDVVAIYFADKHFDFVKPDGKYTKDISGVVADPNGGFLVGGVSEVEVKDVKSGGGCVRLPPSGSLGLPRPSLLQANSFMLNFVAMAYDLANHLLLLLTRVLETSYTCSSLCCACCWLANASGCCWLGEPFGLLLAALSLAAVCWALTCELSLRLLLSF